ncbi:discoidin domain-containing protein [Luteolibacter sp. SL250]|uniref:sialate O-acetylesterase n=1 Tax=Luteolibacter sp. SL250 TaxID=2995170 RepID=UPI002271EDD0|nr:sialate O-acetylesterase [Luteolibacter sp. SL250]WAC21510.1 discoidin domain-containing protein [Luteolibacter sp. SL250]
MSKTIPWGLAALLSVSVASAEITLAPLFQDGAVLQREKPAPVWGKATPGKDVTVTFAGQTKNTKADASGRWQVALDPLSTSAEGRPLSVTETGLAPKEVKDILVGEVWLGSGQSNMEWTVSNTTPENKAEAAKGSVPLLRLFQVPKKVSNKRQETVDAKWTNATPQTATNFSAVGYFFGKYLTEELKVPVGIIHSSWGGSRIEPWWADEGLKEVPDLVNLYNDRIKKQPGFPEYDDAFKKYVGDVRAWSDAAQKALDGGFPAPDMPAGPELLKAGSGAETGTYQAMIHPLVPYALRGFLWYQGESNSGEGMAYTLKQEALLAGWRRQFRAPEAPFLYVQLAPYFYNEGADKVIPQFWWAQQAFLKVPHSGMAVTNDIGNPKDIHPKEKMEVARRLFLWAMADTYGKKDLVHSGPLFKGYKVTDKGIEISFDHTGGGLTTRDGKAPTLFEIAGADAQFQPAEATISADGKTLLVNNPAVAKPDRVRFAWSQVAAPNLMNKEGLPAGAFYTHYPVDPALGTNLLKGKPHKSSHPNTYGWDLGLTDGTWGTHAPTAYATDASDTFPKTVTVDLGAAQDIQAVIYGTPSIGATKTVAVSISEDGTNFTEVGRNDFPAKKAARAEARFAPKKARYIRATFIANHGAQDDFGTAFAFLSEIEAYGPQK